MPAQGHGFGAGTGFTTVTVTGTSGDITQTSIFTLAVSAAVGAGPVAGTPVGPLASEFNLNGIYQDGTTYSTGGLDGVGYSYSANLLSTSRVLNNILFDFGPANQLDAVSCNGQSVTLPQGQHSSLCCWDRHTGKPDRRRPSRSITPTERVRNLCKA